MVVKAPFVWFGGKRRVAAHVWDALGDPHNYIEPFAGSLAVLLERPSSAHPRGVETVNDADGFIANFWRAVAAVPDEVAAHADWPINETDLLARHLWLVNNTTGLLDGLEADPDWFDPKIAGWWAWGINAWIGSGWCSGSGAWRHDEGRVRRTGSGPGVAKQRPHLGDAGRGVHRDHGTDGLDGYLAALASRLRNVRVCCGDWSRVVTKGAMSHGKTVGVFLDPPYLGEVRQSDLYAVDDDSISVLVRDWCLAHGDDPRLRIVLAGYTAEHDHMMPSSWRRVRWSGTSAYSTAAMRGGNLSRRHGECLWLSPHCSGPLMGSA